MKSKLALAVVVTGFLWISIPAVAHHGDAGRYDENLVTMGGTVVELQLINPHSIIIFDVTDASGKVVRWQAEMTGPNNLARGFGWTRNTLKHGDRITVLGRRVKSGAPYMNLSERAVIWMTDSKRLMYKTNNAEVPPGVIVNTPAAVPAAPANPPAGGAAY